MRARARRVAAAVRSPVRFAVGIVLIGASFLVYLAYPLIALLPASGTVKITATVAASALSWGAFGAGIYLAGRLGYRWLRRRLVR